MIDRIAKLLALAEQAGTPEEAETAFAKAQELASRHSIDLELARVKAAPGVREKPVKRTITMGTRGKRVNASLVALFDTIGRSNDVRVLVAQDSTYVVAHGIPSDIDQTEAIWASVAPTMVRFGDAHVRDKDAAWRSEWDTVWDPSEYTYVKKAVSGQGARRSFYDGFISKIGTRLSIARAAQIKDADARHFHDVPAEAADVPNNLPIGTALVLKDKAAEVEEFMYGEFKRQHGRKPGSWKGGRSNGTSSHSSHNAGSAAANNAALGNRRGIGA
jgi:hypothetical protein